MAYGSLADTFTSLVTSAWTFFVDDGVDEDEDFGLLDLGLIFRDASSFVKPWSKTL